MAYEIFKEILSKEQYFSRWQPETVATLSPDLQNYIYNKYLFKRQVLIRDNFECQNELCKTPQSSLTIHHVKWQKNGGKDVARNGLTICKACHNGFNKGRLALKIRSRQELPSHVRGHTFKIHPIVSVNWKKIKKEMDKLRKEVKDQHGRGLHLTIKEILMLMRFLHIPYYEFEIFQYEDEVESVYDVELEELTVLNAP